MPNMGSRVTRPVPGHHSPSSSARTEPVMMKPMCLACHGAEVAPEVQAAIAERYPDDRATGYRAGELRGVIWAELRPRT